MRMGRIVISPTAKQTTPYMKHHHWMRATLVVLGLITSNAFAQSGPPPLPEPMELLTGYFFQDTNFLSIWATSP